MSLDLCVHRFDKYLNRSKKNIKYSVFWIYFSEKRERSSFSSLAIGFPSTWNILFKEEIRVTGSTFNFSLVTIIEPDRTIIGNYRVVAHGRSRVVSAPTKTRPSARRFCVEMTRGFARDNPEQPPLAIARKSARKRDSRGCVAERNLSERFFFFLRGSASPTPLRMRGWGTKRSSLSRFFVLHSRCEK